MGLFTKDKNQIPEIKTNPMLPQYSAIAPYQYTPQPPELMTPPQPMPQGFIPHPETLQQTTFSQTPQQTTFQNQMPSITKELDYRENPTFTSEQPFFIRIDKFNETQDNFSRINQKIKEMEKILSSLESTKNAEERELDIWKQDITEMKSLLSNIDKEIFSKI